MASLSVSGLNSISPCNNNEDVSNDLYCNIKTYGRALTSTMDKQSLVYASTSNSKTPVKVLKDLSNNTSFLDKSIATSVETQKRKREPKKVLKNQLVTKPLYNEIFKSGWIEAKSRLASLQVLVDDAKKAAILNWVYALQIDSILYVGLKTIFEDIFTNTREDKVGPNFKSVFLSNLEELASIDDDTSVGLNSSEKETGIKHFLWQLFQSLKYQVSASETADTEIKQIQMKENKDVLFYVTGSLINKLLKPNKSQASRIIGQAMRENNQDKVPRKLREWTDLQNRNGLKYATEEAFQFFELIYSHILKFYNEKHVPKKGELALRSMNFDENLNYKWENICEKAGILKEQAEPVLKCIKRTFINTAGNGHTNKLRNYISFNKRKKRMDGNNNTKENNRQKIEKNVKAKILYELAIKNSDNKM